MGEFESETDALSGWGGGVSAVVFIADVVAKVEGVDVFSGGDWCGLDCCCEGCGC